MCGRINLLIASKDITPLKPTTVIELVESNSILYGPVISTTELLSIPKVFHGLQVMVEEDNSTYRYDSLHHSWKKLGK